METKVTMERRQEGPEPYKVKADLTSRAMDNRPISCSRWLFI